MMKKSSLPSTQQMLLAIAGALVDDIELLTMRTTHRSALLLGGMDYLRLIQHWKKEKIARRAFYDLRRRKFVATRKKGNKMLVTLTDKGLSHVIHVQAKNAPHCTQGEYIIAAFDIPETERRARAQLRQFLRTCRFSMLQHSVWVCEYDVYDALHAFIKKIDIEDWVTVFRAKK